MSVCLNSIQVQRAREVSDLNSNLAQTATPSLHIHLGLRIGQMLANVRNNPYTSAETKEFWMNCGWNVEGEVAGRKRKSKESQGNSDPPKQVKRDATSSSSMHRDL